DRARALLSPTSGETRPPEVWRTASIQPGHHAGCRQVDEEAADGRLGGETDERVSETIEEDRQRVSVQRNAMRSDCLTGEENANGRLPGVLRNKPPSGGENTAEERRPVLRDVRLGPVRRRGAHRVRRRLRAGKDHRR